jgi:hypothetical protein
MVSAVSTIDLMEPAPDRLHWLPTAYNGAELQAVRKANKRPPDGKLRIVSCPTNPIYKSTSALVAAVARLQREGMNVELILAENMRWEDALKIKATADVVFDQVMFGYGCNGVEAWGMGLPVIAGGQPWTLAKMTELWGELPFYVATEDTIAEAIVAMSSAETRKEYTAKGLAHFKRFHAERPALTRLAELYSMAMNRKITEQEYRLDVPVAFMNPQHRPIFDHRSGKRLAWENGVLATDDPELVHRLKAYEKRRPRWGIKEVVA